VWEGEAEDWWSKVDEDAMVTVMVDPERRDETDYAIEEACGRLEDVDSFWSSGEAYADAWLEYAKTDRAQDEDITRESVVGWWESRPLFGEATRAAQSALYGSPEGAKISVRAALALLAVGAGLEYVAVRPAGVEYTARSEEVVDLRGAFEGNSRVVVESESGPVDVDLDREIRVERAGGLGLVDEDTASAAERVRGVCPYNGFFTKADIVYGSEYDGRRSGQLSPIIDALTGGEAVLSVEPVWGSRSWGT
jgi:hypothetical protein